MKGLKRLTNGNFPFGNFPKKITSISGTSSVETDTISSQDNFSIHELLSSYMLFPISSF